MSLLIILAFRTHLKHLHLQQIVNNLITLICFVIEGHLDFSAAIGGLEGGCVCVCSETGFS